MATASESRTIAYEQSLTAREMVERAKAMRLQIEQIRRRIEAHETAPPAPVRGWARLALTVGLRSINDRLRLVVSASAVRS